MRSSSQHRRGPRNGVPRCHFLRIRTQEVTPRHARTRTSARKNTHFGGQEHTLRRARTHTWSVEDDGDGVDEDSDQATDDGAVDPDELQVAADVELDLAGGLLAVPALDRVGDDRG